jgi:hypothetical protein
MFGLFSCYFIKQYSSKETELETSTFFLLGKILRINKYENEKNNI